MFTGKVFSQLNFAVPDGLLQGAATGKQGVIEFILATLRSKVSYGIYNLIGYIIHDTAD